MSQMAVAPFVESGSCTESCHSCDGCCDCGSSEAARAAEVHHWQRWAWWLTAGTIAWNALEAVLSLIGGIVARSIALVGFGLDSVIEVSSALIIVWRLSHPNSDHEADERAEQRAVRLIAVSFFAIAAYLIYDGLGVLLGAGSPPKPSSLGVVIAGLSLVVMPLLGWAKRRVATRLGSVALEADAGQTRLCAWLSAVVLLGLAANGLLGWWWMDAVAGLAVAALAIREGQVAWTSGDLCCELEMSAIFPCAPDCCPACPIVAV